MVLFCLEMVKNTICYKNNIFNDKRIYVHIACDNIALLKTRVEQY